MPVAWSWIRDSSGCLHLLVQQTEDLTVPVVLAPIGHDLDLVLMEGVLGERLIWLPSAIPLGVEVGHVKKDNLRVVLTAVHA